MLFQYTYSMGYDEYYGHKHLRQKLDKYKNITFAERCEKLKLEEF